MSNDSKLRNILQNNQPVYFKSLKVMKKTKRLTTHDNEMQYDNLDCILKKEKKTDLIQIKTIS